jgi:RNA polymerase sigma-70 factor (ECF subfamily)
VNEISNFAQLIRKAQDRDSYAAAELMRRYEPAVRRAVRLRLFDARLRRVFDSMDICQSVMGNFFDCLARGKYPLESPDQLVKLLVKMANNKLTDQVRRQQAQRRDARQLVGFDINDEDFAGHDPSPSRVVEAREMLETVRRRLSREEQRLLELRHEGEDWDSIARNLGGTPESLRKKLARALERVQQEIKLAV